jgi:endonuclease YncB( thermonuclease family)
MVLRGWAVSYSDKYKKEEDIAKNKRSGIWKGRFMRPELYRALHMNQKNNKKIKKR